MRSPEKMNGEESQHLIGEVFTPTTPATALGFPTMNYVPPTNVHPIRSNAIIQRLIMKYLSPVPYLFRLSLVSKAWHQSVEAYRYAIMDGQEPLTLLTLSKQTLLSSDAASQGPRNKHWKLSLKNCHPLIVLEKCFQNLIGPNTRIHTVELLGLSITEIHYLLKKLASIPTNSAFSQHYQQQRRMRKTTGVFDPTLSLLPQSMMDEGMDFPPTPVCNLFSIHSLTIGWTNSSYVENLTPEEAQDLVILAKMDLATNHDTAAFVGSTFDTSLVQDDEEALAANDSSDEDIDEFIEFDENNEDYNEKIDQSDQPEVEVEDEPELTTLKRPLAWTLSELKLLQSIEDVLFVDVINEGEFITMDIVSGVFNGENHASFDDITLDDEELRSHKPQSKLAILDFIFSPNPSRRNKRLTFLRNPFFYYSEDSYQDLINSELKPYLSAMNDRKNGGSLSTYSRMFLWEVISNNFTIDNKFLKESWEILLKPLYEYHLLNWSDEIHKEQSNQATILQYVLRNVVRKVDRYALSGQSLYSALLSDFESTYDDFVQDEEVSMAIEMLLLMSQTTKTGCKKPGFVSLDVDASSMHFPSLTHSCTIIDKFFAEVCKYATCAVGYVISWRDLLQHGHKRNLKDNLDSIEQPAFKKKKIILQ